MPWALQAADGAVFLLNDGYEQTRRQLTAANVSAFRDWTSRYKHAVEVGTDTALLDVGREIFAWVEAQQWMSRMLAGSGAIRLDIATGKTPCDDERAFLDIPWELLADQSGHLALDATRPFCVQRRLGSPGTPASARYKDLALMFMAASPRNVLPLLDYEREEAGILNATDLLPLTLAVEESGCLDFFIEKLRREGPFEVVHLSCHGEIRTTGPKLLLENPQGGVAPVSAEALVAAFGEKRPNLVFLSACQTAGHSAGSASLAEHLLRYGVSAAMGWDTARSMTRMPSISRASSMPGSPVISARHMQRLWPANNSSRLISTILTGGNAATGT